MQSSGFVITLFLGLAIQDNGLVAQIGRERRLTATTLRAGGKGDRALFRNEIENGSDPDLKDFARKTLPRIVDHLDRALKLAGENGIEMTLLR